MVSPTPVRWREPDYQFIGRPYFVHEAVLKLEALIEPGWTVFEWGSGSSTLWLAVDMMAASVVSLEHDAEWYEKTRDQLERYFVDNVELVRADLGGPYEDYINRYDVFDLIIVDGRNRAACLANAVDHLRPGSLLVLDDSQRYQVSVPSGWRRWAYVTQGGSEVGVRTTTIWRK